MEISLRLRQPVYSSTAFISNLDLASGCAIGITAPPSEIAVPQFAVVVFASS
jgi:hypothetical protein